MRTLVLKVCDHSLDGVVAVEDTEVFEFCGELPDDQEQPARNRRALERAGLHFPVKSAC